MAELLPTADDVILVVKTLIAELGADAFKMNGRIQLYSGPRQVIALLLNILGTTTAALLSKLPEIKR